MVLWYNTLFFVSLSFFIFYICRGLRDERVEHKEARVVLYARFSATKFLYADCTMTTHRDARG